MSRVFVGNLSWGADNESLSEHFSQYGQVTDAVTIQDRETGGSRGFGFVTFSTPEQANAAVEKANNKEFLDRPLTVKIAVERTERADRK